MSEFGTEILIFAGTTEGRELAEHLAGAGVHCTVSVATEYGAQILGPGKGRTVLQGRLTQKQMEVLRSITRGLSNPDISKQLGISLNAVKQHIRAVFAKLGAANRTEAATIAMRKHLLKL